MGWKQALDRAHSLAQLEALEAEAHHVIAELEEELPDAVTIAELEERDAQLAGALDAIDAVTFRAMKVHLEHVLAHEGSIGAPTRNMFAQTVLTYADNLGLLSQRARDIAERGRSPSPDHVATLVVRAARASLSLRSALRDGVLDLVRDLAKADVPEADRHARNAQLDERERKRWSAVRRDLEVLAQTPAAIASAPMPKRVAAWPDQLDEPDPVREPTLGELIEID